MPFSPEPQIIRVTVVSFIMMIFNPMILDAWCLLMMGCLSMMGMQRQKAVLELIEDENGWLKKWKEKEKRIWQ